MLATPFVLLTLIISQSSINPHHPHVGTRAGDPLERLNLSRADLAALSQNQQIKYVGMTKYLNNARSVVTTTIDDSSRFVPDAIGALDKYGIKATIAISTQREPISKLWPRLEQAVKDGHEVGSHSRRHQCQWPDTEAFCRQAYSQDELAGSRNDILTNTSQPYVWSWVYPCGNCADYEFVHERLAQAGYLVARNYPDERRGGILVPDLQTWALDPYHTAFTQVVQKRGGIAPAGRTDVKEINSKFDEVHQNGGIYHFLSHPQWLDYGPEQFYEQHLSYLGGRRDVWYVPFGPLYAYQIVRENTVVSRVQSKGDWERFVVYNDLDPAIYGVSVTLEFEIPPGKKVEAAAGDRPLLELKAEALTDRFAAEYFRSEGTALFVTVRPNTVVQLRLAD